MPRTEDGEFILELGHRQLLSVFFIVVILLGVSFTMGYIVGRNSLPAAASVSPPAKPAPEPPAGSVTSAAAPAAQSEAPLAPGQVLVNKAAPAPAATMPAQPPEVKVEPSAAPLPERPSPAEPKPKSMPVEERAAGPLHGQAQAGQTYLQVGAVRKADAEMIAGILRKKGFPQAFVAPGPNETLFRVLVGPLKDAAAVSKTRMDLEAAGFKPITRKY